MAGVLAFDLAPYRNGFAAGDGQDLPVADAIVFPDYGNDLGALGVAFEDHVLTLIERFEPSVIIYEAPLLLQFDKLPTLRRTYGMGFELERICTRRGIRCLEEDPKNVKKALTGDPYAKKPHMVKAARALGIVLPKALEEGREDAADAFGAWLVGIACWNPIVAGQWDQRLHAARGALI